MKTIFFKNRFVKVVAGAGAAAAAMASQAAIDTTAVVAKLGEGDGAITNIALAALALVALIAVYRLVRRAV